MELALVSRSIRIRTDLSLTSAMCVQRSISSLQGRSLRHRHFRLELLPVSPKCLSLPRQCRQGCDILIFVPALRPSPEHFSHRPTSHERCRYASASCRLQLHLKELSGLRLRKSCGTTSCDMPHC